MSGKLTIAQSLATPACALQEACDPLLEFASKAGLRGAQIDELEKRCADYHAANVLKAEGELCLVADSPQVTYDPHAWTGEDE